jgi:hypothetical protein
MSGIGLLQLRSLSMRLLPLLLLLPFCAVPACTSERRAAEVEADAELRVQLAELEALPLPGGADAQVWASLKQGLRAMLEDRIASGRAAAKAPTADRSRTALTFDSAAGELHWGYSSSGDYNQDGEVNISDLTPLGVHFNKPVPVGQPDSIIAVVDGNGDGLITISDLSPLGASIGSRALSYNVYSSLNVDDVPAGNSVPSSIEPLGTVALAQAEGAPTQQRRRFTFTVESPAAEAYYWVRPCDTANGSGAEGTRSNLAGGPPNAPPFPRIDLCPAVGAAPFEAQLDASGSSDLDGSVAVYRWDFDGDGDFDQSGASPQVTHTYPAGNYLARLEVEDDRGAVGTTTVAIHSGTPPTFAVSPPLAPEEDGLRISPVLGLAGGLPAMLYSPDNPQSTDPDPIYFRRALDPLGSAWDAPVQVGTRDFGLLELHSVAGRPAVVYFRQWTPQEPSRILVRRALDPDGVAWGSEVLAAVHPDGDHIIPVWAGEVEGRLYVLFSASQTGFGADELLYARAANAEASAWEPPQLIDNSIGGDTPGDGFSGHYVSLVNGSPALLFTDSATSRAYILTSSAGGTLWSGPHELPIGAYGTNEPGSVFDLTGPLEVEGQPAVFFSRVNTLEHEIGAIVHVIRASAADGSAWGPEVAIKPGLFYGRSVDPTIVNGKPAITVQPSEDSEIDPLDWYLQADDALGTSWTGTPAPLPGRDQQLRVIDGRPWILYSSEYACELGVLRGLDPDGAGWVPEHIASDNATTRVSGGSLLDFGGRPAVPFGLLTESPATLTLHLAVRTAD